MAEVQQFLNTGIRCALGDDYPFQRLPRAQSFPYGIDSENQPAHSAKATGFLIDLKGETVRMSSMKSSLVFLILAATFCSAADTSKMNSDWKKTLQQILPVYGHRNWIVVADSAYPDQQSEGIETIVSHADQMDVLRQVLSEIAASKHVRPRIYLDRELKFVKEQDAPGVEDYRKQLYEMLDKAGIHAVAHEQIIEKLDKAGEKFKVLLIKTNMTIPYTSVFLQLDCAYWSDDAEKRLREAMAGGDK